MQLFTLSLHRAIGYSILLVMRSTAIILLIGCLQVSASGYSQKITLSVKNAPLEKVFQEIKKQSGYYFWYADELLQQAKSVDVEVKDATIEQALEACLKGQPFAYEIVEKLVVIKRKGEASKKNSFSSFFPGDTTNVIKGRVVNRKGEPLEGTTIQLKGSNRGTSSNSKGEFSLTIPDSGGSLVISFLGYETREIAVNEPTGKLEIMLNDKLQALSQIVAIGYGQERKGTLTGAVSTISGREIVRVPLPNINQALAGRLPGLVSFNTSAQPGNDNPTLLIRGLSTLGDNSPLFVIDGIVRPDISYIDPNDIESISMLKDAAAIAVFGARSANGVILVTTKRGRKENPTITYSANVGVQQAAQLIKSLDSYNTALLWNEANRNEGIFDPGPGGFTGYDEASLEKIRNGTDLDRYANADWFDAVLGNRSVQHMHNLSVTGGNDAIRYFVSAGYLNQEGLYTAANFRRYNIRSNLDATINKNLVFSLNLAGRTETSNSSGYLTGADLGFPSFGQYSSYNSIVNSAMLISNLEPIRYTNGTYHYNANWLGNPYLESLGDNGYNTRQNNIFESSMYLNYSVPFLQGLSVKALLAFDKRYTFSKSFLKPYETYILNDDNTFSSRKNTERASLSENLLQQKSTTFEASANYDKQLNGKNRIKALLLYSQTKNSLDEFGAGRINFQSPLIDELNFGSPVGLTNNGKGDNDARQSLVGRLGYEYDQKYLFDFSFRYDGSDVFPPGHRWGFFPSFAAGWVVSREPLFMKAISFMDYLKIRVSWGQAGNDKTGRFQYLQGYQIPTGFFFRRLDQIGYPFGGVNATASPSLKPGVIPNPNFTWEKATIGNIGFEAIFLNNKISIEADYFHKRTKDILSDRSFSIPALIGGTLPQENLAIVNNEGVEFSIRYDDNTGENWKYHIGSTFTFNKSKVVFLPEAAGTPEASRKSGKPVSPDAVIGYLANGLYQSTDDIAKGPVPLYPDVAPGDIRYADTNGDNMITPDDRVIISKGSTPGIIYGLNADVSFKGLALNLQFQGAGNAETYLDPSVNWAFYAGIQKAFEYQRDRWTPENPQASYPRLTIYSSNNRESSSYWVRNSAYLRLKNAELSYTFPQTITSRISAENIRVFINGSNLLIFSRMKIVDPETGASGAAYPVIRVYNLGITISL